MLNYGETHYFQLKVQIIVLKVDAEKNKYVT